MPSSDGEDATRAPEGVEAGFGRGFESFFRSMDSLRQFLNEAIRDVINRRQQFEDVSNLTTDMKIPPEDADDFVALWEEEFGTRHFGAIVPRARPTDDDVPTASDDAGHETKEQPEEVADYTPRVLDFVANRGSLLAMQDCIRRYWNSEAQAHTVAKSSVVLAVGALESAVAEVERIRLRTHVGAIGNGGPEFSLDELIQLGDLDAVVEEAIERRVDKLCYGTVTDWRRWYEKSFSIDMAELALDWDSLEEIVQRRHIIVHNEGRVSRLYLKRTQRDDVAVGDLLPLGPDYVLPAVNQCFVLGLRMTLRAWEKLGTDPEHIYTHVDARCYDSLVSGQWDVAKALARYGMELSAPQSQSELIHRVNWWIARKAKGEDVGEEVENWDVAPLSLKFRAARAALLDDYERLTELIPAAIAAEEINRNALLAWPLFRGLRSQPLFAELLSRLDQDRNSSAG